MGLHRGDAKRREGNEYRSREVGESEKKRRRQNRIEKKERKGKSGWKNERKKRKWSVIF